MKSSSAAKHKRLRIRILADSVVAMGPGKADLLEAIATHGSISGAARAMGMSYRRAWILVDIMNACFKEPLVLTAKGGAEGGGASLTPTGTQVLRAFRQLSASAEKRFGALVK